MTQKHARSMRALTAATNKATGQQHCSHGNHYADPAGGYYKQTSNGRQRFICASCRAGKIARTTP